MPDKHKSGKGKIGGKGGSSKNIGSGPKQQKVVVGGKGGSSKTIGQPYKKK